MSFEDLKQKYQFARIGVVAMRNSMESMIKGSEKAEAPIRSLIYLIVFAVLAGALIPTGINSLAAGRNASWTASEIAMYGVISVMLLVAVVMLIVKIATD